MTIWFYYQHISPIHDIRKILTGISKRIIIFLLHLLGNIFGKRRFILANLFDTSKILVSLMKLLYKCAHQMMRVSNNLRNEEVCNRIKKKQDGDDRSKVDLIIIMCVHISEGMMLHRKIWKKVIFDRIVLYGTNDSDCRF